MLLRPILMRLAACAMALGSAIAAAPAPAAEISNRATMRVTIDGVSREIASNRVVVEIEPERLASRIQLRRPSADYRMRDATCRTAPDIWAMGSPVEPAELDAATPIDSVDDDEPFIVMLTSPGSNRDPSSRENATVNWSADSQHGRLTLTETAPDSGIFAGGLSPELAGCDPILARGEPIRIDFPGDAYSLPSTTAALNDPVGFIFDAATGALIDGARISILDEAGQPATVFGDDGVSIYPSSVVSGGEAVDSGGRRYRFAHGNYRFPRVPAGRYRLVVVPPDTYRASTGQSGNSLARLRDPFGKPFVLNDASFGRSFSIDGDTGLYADLPLDRKGETALLLTKSASVREASPGDFIQYHVTMTNRGDRAATAVQVTDILPSGLRYERGSARGAEEPVVSANGRTLAFVVPAIAGGATVQIGYVVSVAPGAPKGDAVNRVLASGSAGSTGNEAAASVRLKPLAMTEDLTVIGRVTEGDCSNSSPENKGLAGIRLVLEDGSFVATDRDGYYHIEGVRAGRHIVQIDTASVPATHEVIGCGTGRGSALSRFVEGQGGLIKRVDFRLRRTGRQAETIPAAPIDVASDAQAAGNRDWLSGQQPGIAMLFPQIDHNPRANTLRVVVKHYPSQRVALMLNGAPIDPLNFDTTDSDAGRNLAVSRWAGLPLAEGDNRLEARVLGADGAVVQTLDRVVHVAGAPVSATYLPGKSRLVADGLSRPLIAVRLIDRAGRPVRDGSVVAFRVDAPHAAAAQDGERADRQRQEGSARVSGDDGIALLALEATSQAGAAHVIVTLGDKDMRVATDIRTWLTAARDDWMVVGFGQGTIGYDILKRRSGALPKDAGDRMVTDGQLAFYAKGRIKGSWLLTIAYDSDRKYDPDRGLLGAIDPHRYYTVYGDASRQSSDAPTRRKLYLRLESRAAYALFGDFDTGLPQSRLGRYDRTLSGIKLGYQAGKASVSGFAAKSDERHGRDEIRGNGLTGPYRLSGRNLVPGSDKVRIEVRDRFRPARILSSTPLTRIVDYDLDLSAGVIRFREPVLSRDSGLNPVFIVVDYESQGIGRKTVAGGHASTTLAKGGIEVGTTALREGDGTVIAADIKAEPIRSVALRAEVAAGGRRGLNDGKAWLAEAEHHGAAADILVYARQQDSGFGLGQQNLAEVGARRLGADGGWRIGGGIVLTASAWHEQQLGGPASRDAGEARLEYRRPTGSVFVGGQFAFDDQGDGRAHRSKLITIGGSRTLFGGKLALSGQTQFAPDGANDSKDFPIRHQISAAWRISDTVRLLGTYEIATAQARSTANARIGVAVTPWAGARLSTAINQQTAAIAGERLSARYGLSQSLPIGTRWTIDATVDSSARIAGTRNAESTHAGTFFSTDGQSGDGDFTAVSLGASYRAGRWSWTGRAEYRDGTADGRTNLTTTILRTLGGGRTITTNVEYSRVKRDRGQGVTELLQGELALAIRPRDSRWSLLERIAVRQERASGEVGRGDPTGVPVSSAGFQASLRIVNNVAVNYSDGRGLEATMHHGIKWVRGSFGADDYDGVVDMVGFDLRKRVDSRVEIGVQATVQNGWTRHVRQFSAGPMVGYSPGGDLWVTAGYNLSGYRDRDFEEDRYTRAGPYLTVRLSFDQRSIGRAARAVAGRR